MQTLARLALPIMASSFLGTAYNITDMVWIGTLGSKAVAGVGVGGMYVWLSQGLVALARMGGQVNVAQCLGRGDKKEASSFSTAALQLTILFALLFSTVCLVFTKPLLGFFHLTDAQTYEYARVYTLITCGLIIFSYLTLTLTGLYTAQGDSKTPLLANLFGLLTNMVMDPLLILGIGPLPRLEVMGAAIATVSAQFLVFLILALNIRRTPAEKKVITGAGLFRPLPGAFYRKIFQIGAPSALQNSLYCMISMLLTRMVSSFGPGAIATQRVGGQIESISWNTAEGFGTALNAFMGQNYGAKKTDRIQKGYQAAFRLMAVWGVLVTAVFVLLPEPISRLFFHEEDVIQIAVNYLIILGFGEAFMIIELMTVGALSGLGKTTLCSLISILLTGARIPLALLLSHFGMGLSGVWWALTISSIAKGVVFYITFQRISRRLDRAWK